MEPPPPHLLWPRELQDCYNESLLARMDFSGLDSDVPISSSPFVATLEDCLAYLAARDPNTTDGGLNSSGGGGSDLRFASLAALLFLLFSGILVAFALKYQRGDHSLGRDGPFVVVVGPDGKDARARKRKRFKPAPPGYRRALLDSLNGKTEAEPAMGEAEQRKAAEAAAETASGGFGFRKDLSASAFSCSTLPPPTYDEAADRPLLP